MSNYTEIVPGTRSIGESLPRVDALAKATGQAVYTVDISLPGMLHAYIIRCPYPHAELVHMNSHAAESMDGVHFVLSANNIDHWFPDIGTFDPGMLALANGEHREGERHLFSRELKHVGDPVAAILAESLELAIEASAKITFEYRVLAHCLSPREACEPDSPSVHQEMNSNVMHIIRRSHGSIATGLAESKVVLTDTFYTSRQKHAQVEPTCCIVNRESDGHLSVWTPTHNPIRLRNSLAAIFKLEASQLRIRVPTIGGSFGKADSLTVEPYALALALISGRAVKLLCSRNEEFQGTDSRHPTQSTLNLGLNADGTIRALSASILVDAGAFTGHSWAVPDVIAERLISHYPIADYDIEIVTVFTNTPNCGAFRGYGGPQAYFPLEHLLDFGCEILGIDSLTARLSMTAVSDSLPYEAGALPRQLAKCIDHGSKLFGWHERRNSTRKSSRIRRGIGMACASWESGPSSGSKYDNYSVANLTIDQDGFISLYTGGIDLGTGLHTALSQICAETVGVSIERVRVASIDTDTSPLDSGAHASRSLVSNGDAVRGAALLLRESLIQFAARRLNVAELFLDLVDNMIVSALTQEPMMTVQHLCSQAIVDGCDLSATSESFGRRGSTAIAQFVDLEVDLDTGAVTLNEVFSCADVGRAINPCIVIGQIEGASVQGIGMALSELLFIDDRSGAISESDFRHYPIPRFTTLGGMKTVLLESGALPQRKELLDTKGCGELGILPTAPAVANAILNATGIVSHHIPIQSQSLIWNTADPDR